MFYKNQYSYFVVDHATSGILLSTGSSILANALADGVLNTHVRQFRVDNSQTTVLMMLNNANKHYYLKNPSTIMELPELNTTSDYLEGKRLIQVRKNSMKNWLEQCTKTLERRRTFFSDIVDLLGPELQKCTEDTPTDIINDMAYVAGVDPITYMDDLRLKVDSAISIKARVHALFEKHKDKLNSLSDAEELKTCYKEAVSELLTNAYI
jgi:hypothetical protein